MAVLDLGYVDEIIAARRRLHGGGKGAPPLVGPKVREGESLNRSCVVMLSAQLQGYIEEVFKSCAVKAIPALATDAVWVAYWKQLDRWGNPNPGNIKNLFLRLGVTDVLGGLSWNNCTNNAVRLRLDHLNQIRNDIAHGGALRVDNTAYSLTLVKAKAFRDFSHQFGQRFEAHALAKV
jgi:hypothetical protein